MLFATFVLRSICFHTLYLICAQIYMFMCSLPCYCCVYAQIYMYMCSLSCLCVQIYVLDAMPCAFQAFYLLLCLFLVFQPLGKVQIQILWSRPTFVNLGLHQRVWIISFMLVFSCLLMLYIHVCLPRYRFCHALCPSWAFAC